MAEEKPIVESFQLDHTKVKAPYVRYIDTETGPNGDVISNYDLRLVQPNENAIPTAGLHTIEHTIAVLLRERIPGYIDCSPFGCRTGFHLLTWGTHPHRGSGQGPEGIVGVHRVQGQWDECPPPPRRAAATIATTACSPPRNGPSRSLRKASAPTRSSARSSDRKPIGMERTPPPHTTRTGFLCAYVCAYGMVGLPSVNRWPLHIGSLACWRGGSDSVERCKQGDRPPFPPRHHARSAADA